MKKLLSWLLIIAICGAILASFALTLEFFQMSFKTMGMLFMSSVRGVLNPTITTDLADYGVITGNNHNEYPQEYFDNLFPAAIEEHFENPVYYYRGQESDTYACEAYLEFSISDPDLFDEHYQSLARLGSTEPFPFDERYEMWNISEIMDISKKFTNENADGEIIEFHMMNNTEVGIVLCDKKESRFIYFALLTNGGSCPQTNDLDYFFNRFGIEPEEFVEKLDLAYKRP